MKKPFLVTLLALAVAAVLLLGANLGLKGIAAKNAESQKLSVMHTLLPGSGEFTDEPYTGEDTNIVAVHKADNGYVVETASNGYVDAVTVWVGVKNDGTVSGVIVRDIHETNGLGMRALTDWQYLSQYLFTKGDAEIGTNVDAISGATVTSKAVTRCVNSAAAVVTGADTASSATSWGG